MGIILLITAIVLFGIVLIPGLIVTVIKCKNWNTYFGQVARAIDIFCNVFFQFILNATLLSKSATIRFGNEGEYMSEVLAENLKQVSTLSVFGRFVCAILIKYKDPQFKN